MRRAGLVVFAGPSLPPEARAGFGEVTWLPPAAGGDVAALRLGPPACLCLIDGLFETRPAPWHKELMLLMAAGTRVFGAASMGALRAAELDRHGMIGIGAIYRSFRTGLLAGDDEVALIHATERLDWAPLTVPLVEVRATLVAACRDGLLDPAHARRLRKAAAEQHFSDRDWPALRRRWTSASLCDDALAAEIERRHVPLKQLDALACLQAALQEGGGSTYAAPAPPMTSFLRKLLVKPT